MIVEVEKGRMGPLIVLSRTHAEFVSKILELEVPEIYDKAVDVFKIVREPGYRTKIAVYSNREDIDPVGACVGLKGIRIQAIIRELEGEKVDILKYEIDSKRFIRNALSPAEVKDVYILDECQAPRPGGSGRQPALGRDRQAGPQRPPRQPALRLEHRRKDRGAVPPDGSRQPTSSARSPSSSARPSPRSPP